MALACAMFQAKGLKPFERVPSLLDSRQAPGSHGQASKVAPCTGVPRSEETPPLPRTTIWP